MGTPILLLSVFVGSGLGGMMRFLCQIWITHAYFPYATLTVNILGSFMIGFFASALKSSQSWISNPSWQAFLVAGFCGGFTTFSSFSLQTLNLLQSHKYSMALLNVGLNVFLCLVATSLGFYINHFIRNQTN